MNGHRWVIIAVPFLLLACGGSTTSPLDDAGNDAGQDGALLDSSQDGTSQDSGPQLTCPSAVPSSGGACGTEGLECEYGVDPRWTCNTIATCSGGVWGVATSTDPTCPSRSAPQCPPSINDVEQGTSCSPSNISCDYAVASFTAFCVCANLGGPIEADGGSSKWRCSNPVGGCPQARPLLGSSCSVTNEQCDYSVCGEPSGLAVRCSGETGTWAEAVSPPCALAN